MRTFFCTSAEKNFLSALVRKIVVFSALVLKNKIKSFNKKNVFVSFVLRKILFIKFVPPVMQKMKVPPARVTYFMNGLLHFRK